MFAGVVELVDTRDLKSLGSDTVPVRARSPAPSGVFYKSVYRGVEQLAARRAHNPEVAGSSPAAATKISLESADSREIPLILRTSRLCSLLRFSSDPNRDPYAEMFGNYWRAPERIPPIVLAASFFAEVVTWV